MEEEKEGYYSAKAIVAQLKMRNDLGPASCYAIGCPFPSSDPADKNKCHTHQCLDPRNTGKCPLCDVRECKQRAHVSWPIDAPKLSILQFYFAISKDNRDGYIDKNDSTLQVLMLRGCIDKSQLVPFDLP